MVGTLSSHCVFELAGSWKAGYNVENLEILDNYKKRMLGFVIFVGMAMTYTISRLVMFITAIVSLRDLPETAYQVVSWSSTSYYSYSGLQNALTSEPRGRCCEL
jgi:hypothetical protein